MPLLVAAVVVLIAGISAVVLHDDKRSAERSTSPSTTVSSTSPTSAASTSSTARSSVPTSATASSIATTVRPPVTSPEAAANGLWAAYAANNQVAAQRFASEDVIRVLFESTYNGEQGMFQGCRRNNDVFDCVYLQPSARYAMTAKADAANGFIVVALSVTPP